MLQIKTIMHNFDKVEKFDAEVNEALADGWDLVRRDVLPGWEGQTTVAYRKLYAELERIIEEPEEDPEDEMICAEWKISRDPAYPYKCTSCGCKVQEPIKNCPHCHKIMLGTEE